MAEDKKTVTFKVADFRVDSFDPSVEGVEPITPEGTAVPAGKAKAVLESAERAGVELEEA